MTAHHGGSEARLPTSFPERAAEPIGTMHGTQIINIGLKTSGFRLTDRMESAGEIDPGGYVSPIRGTRFLTEPRATIAQPRLKAPPTSRPMTCPASSGRPRAASSIGGPKNNAAAAPM
jgi:hypothetical protein